ncbi:MAG: hypothetical protein JSS30_04070 [Verrucomicrobia bacterium]|nr:hypothetical protein [Verrucomicrobiota bacterium]
MMKTTYDPGPISIKQLVPNSASYGENKNKKALQTVIKNHVGVIALSIAAIQAFIRGDMPDPLVGENACQIRAAYYCAQATDSEKMESLKEICPKLEDLMARVSKLKMPEMASVDQVIEENDLDLSLPPVVAPIVFGHILTVSKQSELSIQKKDLSLKEECDPKKLEAVSNGYARDLIKHSRRSLSAWSVQYLRDEAARLNMPGPENVLTDHMGLQTAPAMPGMKVLCAAMKANGIMIVLKNRIIDEEGKDGGQITLHYSPDYQVVTPRPQDVGRPAMIIEAVSISSRAAEQLEKEIIAEGIESIILANFAAHPQYGGSCKLSEPKADGERERWHEIAKRRGLCAANPDLCRMYHIYAGRVGGVA